MQHSFEHDEHDDGINGEKGVAQSLDGPACKFCAEEMSEYSTCAESEQRYRNREERKVIEEHHGEESCES